MRTVAVLVTLVIGGTAAAQPGGAPPPPYPPQPPPQPYPPPPHQYQPAYHYPAQLTAEEHALLLRGEITDGEHFGGGVASFFLGFGSGQAIQGRWSDTGWIFTLGEVGTFAMMIAGIYRTFDDCNDRFDNSIDCDHSDGPPLIIIGALGFTVFRVWEVVDAFSGPGEHNRRVRDLKYRMGIPVRVGDRFKPYVNKTRDGGATAGLTIRF